MLPLDLHPWRAPSPVMKEGEVVEHGPVRDVFESPQHAYTQAQKLYTAVGAVSTHRTTPYPSTHNLGTCRMSERPEDGVVDTWGRAHDVPNLFISDGSQFTTGAAANPTLTIVALAIRQAEHIAEALKKGEV